MTLTQYGSNRSLTYFLFLTCLLLNSLAIAQSEEESSITLNMNNADIRTFITNIGQMTGKDFIIHPRVKGNVTIISQHPMTKDEVYQVFVSTLNVHGFAVVTTDGATKIVPTTNVKKDVVTLASKGAPGKGDEYVTRILQLKHANALKLIPLVRPLVAKEGHLAGYAPSNVLIIIDRAENVSRIVTLINRIDISSHKGVEIVSLKYASAVDVVRLLASIYKPTPGRQMLPDEVTKYVADKRTNSIILSGENIAREQVKQLIRKIDSPLKLDSGNIKVIYLHNANAVDIAKVLNGIKDNIEDQSEQATLSIGKVQNKNSAGRSDNKKLKTNIQADESTNSLIIAASPSVMKSLETVIKQLDIRRAQVLVEAIIVEVSDKLSSDIGIQWGAVGNAVGAVSSFNGTGIDPGTLLNAFNGTTSDSASALSSVNGFVGYVAGGNKNKGIGAILHALSADDDANILSTPSIIVMDNEEASIIVGQEVPFITGSTTSSNNTNPFTTVTRKKVGIKLKITPQINEGDSVKLKIYQEVSSVSTAIGATDLVTNQREIDTTVLIEDGATIVLGGLMSEQTNESINKVPLLGDIPIMGELFKTRVDSKEKRNLMVFLHPIIIRDFKRLNEISGKKYTFIRQQQLDLQKKNTSLLSKKDKIIIPPWDESEVLPWKVK